MYVFVGIWTDDIDVCSTNDFKLIKPSRKKPCQNTY